MKLRIADIGDCRMLFEWANDNEIRKMALSSEPIEWESHKKWIEKKLSDPNSRIYIAINDQGQPVGQIRFDIMGGGAEIDVHTKPNLRGKGIGTQIISFGTNQYFSETHVDTIHAIIKLKNIKSLKAFKNAGFKEVGQEIIKEHGYFHLVKNRY